MATTKLKLKFGTTSGEKTFSYNYIDTSLATKERVVSLMDTIIANGEIFRHVPLSKVSAVLETTSSATIDLS